MSPATEFEDAQVLSEGSPELDGASGSGRPGR